MMEDNGERMGGHSALKEGNKFVISFHDFAALSGSFWLGMSWFPPVLGIGLGGKWMENMYYTVTSSGDEPDWRKSRYLGYDIIWTIEKT